MQHVSNLTDKKLLIFGGAGSLGQALVSFYRQYISDIVVVSRDEAKHWELKNKFPPLNSRKKISTIICDVRDPRRVSQVIRQENPTYVIIAQALKQVDTCENQPSESIDTNVIGVRNVLDAIEENSIRPDNKITRVCFVSTDKACNPINVYGMCKSISEKLVIATAAKSSVAYMVTRYGNVISSRGSIVPLFLKQAKEAEAFTITDPNMTRFMMLLEESVKLIDMALAYGTSGSMWVPKLDSFKVEDLATYFSKKFNKPTKIIGIRPGEKIHEIMMNELEDIKKEDYGFAYCIRESWSRQKASGPFKDYSSKDVVISYEELSRRLDQFLEKETYDRKI